MEHATTNPHCAAGAHWITQLEEESLDGYNRRGVALSRTSAHVIVAALARDAHDLRTRPCEANTAAADEQDELVRLIARALSS